MPRKSTSHGTVTWRARSATNGEAALEDRHQEHAVGVGVGQLSPQSGHRPCQLVAVVQDPCAAALGHAARARSPAELVAQRGAQEHLPQCLAEQGQLGHVLVGTLAGLGIALLEQRQDDLLDEPRLALRGVLVQPEVPAPPRRSAPIRPPRGPR